jgi:hypothetical protein
MRKAEETTKQRSPGPERTYEQPELRVLGTVQELTLDTKTFGLSDGHTLLDIVPLTSTSLSLRR